MEYISTKTLNYIITILILALIVSAIGFTTTQFHNPFSLYSNLIAASNLETSDSSDETLTQFDPNQLVVRINNINHFINVFDLKPSEQDGNIIYDPRYILNLLTPSISQEQEYSAYVSDGVLYNCQHNSVFAPINIKLLSTAIEDSINNSRILYFNIENYIDSKYLYIYKLCIEYQQLLPDLQFAIASLVKDDRFMAKELFTIKEDKTWKILNEHKFNELIQRHNANVFKTVFNGEFEIIDNELRLYREGTNGKHVDLLKTQIAINEWLKAPTTEIPIIYKEIYPVYTNIDVPIVDFTNKIASGYTRIDILRNGYHNIGVNNAEYGLEELDGLIIKPGNEFSYINTISPQPNGLTKNGRLIGEGICNATTTLFRAALEAGLPITERNYHAHNYESYSWSGSHKYPFNIVDAAYFTDPVVDFKFINNYDYPLYLKFTKYREGNYQYHTIDMYTDQKADIRTVQLTNFKTFNNHSSKSFEGSFDRIVKENGAVITADQFYSMYR